VAISLPPIRVLIFHGYLLSGTGSNVYNASLARALRGLGHEVHLLCQDRNAADLPWVDAVGDWDDEGLRVQPTSDEQRETSNGSVTVYTPDIGQLLPVYVRDRYAGFEVKEFPELTDAELDAYIERNVAAVNGVAERAGGFEAALANHLVMGPVILARAGIRFALKVHGSDLSYTVLPHLDRFRPYAVEASRAAAGILVGSEHIAERLRLVVDEPDVNSKVAPGPPGVDTDAFAPVEPGEEPARLRALAGDLAALEPVPDRDVHQRSSWDREPSEAAAAVESLAAAEGPRVVFIGKLIVSKGVDLLLPAWPLVHARNPTARLLVAGFGPFRASLEDLWRALGGGDVEAADEIAARGRGLEGGEDAPLRHLDAFLSDPPPGYADAARRASETIAFAGRLEHDEVARLVPACDALVFPSTFPEAFGMVAAEAASAGVLPVSAAHSGALEVSEALAAELPAEAARLVSFEVGDEAPGEIADRLNAWFALDAETRSRTRAALRETAVRLWSWEGVARSVIEASS
jgi:glycosyltransferase involved in cell wall biosynthesis